MNFKQTSGESQKKNQGNINAIIQTGLIALSKNNYQEAAQLFEEADYKPGLKKIADIYMNQLKSPLLAYSYYEKAGDTEKTKEIRNRMFGVLSRWIHEDDSSEKALVPDFFKKVKNKKELIDRIVIEKSKKIQNKIQKKISVKQDKDIHVQVHPELKKLAQDILNQNK